MQELLEEYQRSRLQGPASSQDAQRTAELPGSAQRPIWNADDLPRFPDLRSIPGLHWLWHSRRAHLLEQEVCAILRPQQSAVGAGQLRVSRAESAAVNSMFPATAQKRHVAIVGNGPLADGQRPHIEAADVVLRFNAMHNRWDGCITSPSAAFGRPCNDFKPDHIWV